MRLRGVVFVQRGLDGDFAHMIRDPNYKKSLFVFNDNVYDANTTPVMNGGNTACIRSAAYKYNRTEPPRASGIPTGWSSESGGFRLSKSNSMTSFTKRAIILAIERIVLLCQEHDIDEVVFSADPLQPNRLGCGIFSPDAAIVDFIMEKLQAIPTRVQHEKCMFTHDRLDKLEQDLLEVADLHRQLAKSSSQKRNLLVLPPARGGPPLLQKKVIKRPSTPSTTMTIRRFF